MFTDPYVSRDGLKGYLKIPLTKTDEDDNLTAAVNVSTMVINNWCKRNFNRDTSVTPTATARHFRTDAPRAYDPGVQYVHDFYSTTGLVIETDESSSGTYGTTWSASDYTLRPLDGIVNEVPGWPYWIIQSNGTKWFPMGLYARPVLRVTALWGWSAVPDPVVQSCKVLASEAFKLKDAPFGVAGYADIGIMRIRENPKVENWLCPYRRARAKVQFG